MYKPLRRALMPLFLVSIASLCLIATHTTIPPAHLHGWVPAARDDMRGWTSSQAPFQLVSFGEPVWQENSRANVRLYAIQDLVCGSHPCPPNGPQLTGDCTSWSSVHAAERTMAVQAVSRGGKWRRLFPAFSYGVGRVDIWRKTVVGRLPAQGCSVAAVAKGMVEIGVLAWDDALDPDGKPYVYSGRLADEWGRAGPPKHLYEVASRHKLGAAALLKSAAEARDALVNGYGVAGGSDFTPGNFRVVDGRIVADNIASTMRYEQRWHHALCIDAYDGTAPNGPWYHIQNSWHPTSHPAPVDGSPVCSFWIHENSMEYIAAQGDTLALSDFESFESREDLNLFAEGQ